MPTQHSRDRHVHEGNPIGTGQTHYVPDNGRKVEIVSVELTVTERDTERNTENLQELR
jgi:hypothetical protein